MPPRSTRRRDLSRPCAVTMSRGIRSDMRTRLAILARRDRVSRSARQGGHQWCATEPTASASPRSPLLNWRDAHQALLQNTMQAEWGRFAARILDARRSHSVSVHHTYVATEPTATPWGGPDLRARTPGRGGQSLRRGGARFASGPRAACGSLCEASRVSAASASPSASVMGRGDPARIRFRGNADSHPSLPVDVSASAHSACCPAAYGDGDLPANSRRAALNYISLSPARLLTSRTRPASLWRTRGILGPCPSPIHATISTPVTATAHHMSSRRL